jgi:branched-chain amino acid transport system permease protein
MAVSSSKWFCGSLAALASLGLATPAFADSLTFQTGYVFQQLFNGLMVGTQYSLLAVSYALLHGITNRIVLSFGDFASFGAYLAITVALVMLATGWAVALAIGFVFLLAVASTSALGTVVQSSLFTPIVKTPSQAIMICSIGVSIVLQESLRLRSDGRDMWLSPLYTDPAVHFDFDGFIFRISEMQVLILFVAASLLTLLALVLTRSEMGRLWRACSENLQLAQLCGIDTTRVMNLTATAAAGFAAASGWIIAIGYGGASFYMGLVFGLKALFATIIGGFGTVSGAIVGGFLLAGIETLWTAFFPIVYRDVAVFLIVVLIFVIKPDGLLSAAIRRDSEA